MSFEIFAGPPVGVTAPGQSVIEGIDKANDVLYISDGVNGGWVPASASAAKANLLAQTAAVANILTYSAPRTGIYDITTYTVQATATSGTLPVTTATFTEGNTGVVGATIGVSGTGTATTTLGQSDRKSVV